jgi:hypothetical protein
METYSMTFDPGSYDNVPVDLDFVMQVGVRGGAAKNSTLNLHSLFYFVKYVSSTKEVYQSTEARIYVYTYLCIRSHHTLTKKLPNENYTILEPLTMTSITYIILAEAQ